MSSSRSLIKAEEADAALADAAGILFHFPQFIEQFVVQALVPLSIIYLILAHSTAAAANVLSVPRPFSCIFAVIFLLAQLISMMPVVVLLSWVLRGNSEGISDASTSVLRIDVVAVAAAFVMHRLAISIKYAYQPKSIYERRMTEWVTYQERLDDQLFASWFKLSRATIEREVAAALTTLEEESTSTYSISQDSFTRLRAGVHKEARVDLDACIIDSNKNRILPVGVLATILLVHINEETSGYVLALQRLTSFIGLFSTFSTTVLRGALSIPILGSSSYDACVIIGAWISNFLLLPTIFTFIAVGIVDHARRQGALETFSRLLQPSPLQSGGRSTVGILATAVQPAILPLENISNVRAFLAVRSLLLAFGAGFHARLVTVISSDLIVLAIVAAYCVFSALTASGIGTISAALVLHHSLVVPAVALCALGLHMAASANTAASQSTAVIAQTRLFMRVASHDSGNITPLSVFGLLDDVEKVLRENAEPITIFGISATPVLTNSLVGGFASVETLLISGAIARLTSSSSSSPSSTSSSSNPNPSVTATPSFSPSTLTNTTTNSSVMTNPVEKTSSSIEVDVGIFFAVITILSVLVALIIALLKRRSRVKKSTTGVIQEKGKEKKFINPLISTEIVDIENTKQHTVPVEIINPSISTEIVDAENIKQVDNNHKHQHHHSTVIDDIHDKKEINEKENVEENIIITKPFIKGWVQHEDPATGDIWYHNLETEEVSWEPPLEEAKGGDE